MKPIRRTYSMRLSVKEKLALTALIVGAAISFLLGYWMTAAFNERHPHHHEIGPDF